MARGNGPSPAAAPENAGRTSSAGSSAVGKGSSGDLYSFDVVPLEFISSIYEEFVTAKGAHYTPGYLVDFMLDEVLPWGGEQWDLKILDPACGSGIFLVKAYQRLIQRWKNAHPDQKPSAEF